MSESDDVAIETIVAIAGFLLSYGREDVGLFGTIAVKSTEKASPRPLSLHDDEMGET